MENPRPWETEKCMWSKCALCPQCAVTADNNKDNDDGASDTTADNFTDCGGGRKQLRYLRVSHKVERISSSLLKTLRSLYE